MFNSLAVVVESFLREAKSHPGNGCFALTKGGRKHGKTTQSCTCIL